MTERTIDFRVAIYERDAHSAYAISQMAKAAGLTRAEWSASHADGLTADEQSAYDAYVAEFDAMWKTGAFS